MKSKSSAPGSMMLLGEYAVLHGALALVCAINKRIEVTLSSRIDNKIIIQSNTLGEYVTERQHMVIEQRFAFVLVALRNYQATLRYGVNILIRSDFSSRFGLGSSAAVTVAMLSALHGFLQKKMSTMALIKEAVAVIRTVQGVGSGADVAASVLGGVVAYQSDPLSVEKLTPLPPLAVVYSGKKASTVQAVNEIMTQSQQAGKHMSLLTAIEQCALAGKQAVQARDWQRLGIACDQQQVLMQDLGVSNATLDMLVQQLIAAPAVLGAKISGAGFGDCMLAIGELPMHYFPRDEAQTRLGVRQLDVHFSTEGVNGETW